MQDSILERTTNDKLMIKKTQNLDMNVKLAKKRKKTLIVTSRNKQRNKRFGILSMSNKNNI